MCQPETHPPSNHIKENLRHIASHTALHWSSKYNLRYHKENIWSYDQVIKELYYEFSIAFTLAV